MATRSKRILGQIALNVLDGLRIGLVGLQFGETKLYLSLEFTKSFEFLMV